MVGAMLQMSLPVTTHLQPVAVVHLLSDVRCIGAEGQLHGGGQGKPPPLDTEGHEAGAEHRCTHVHVQVGDLDVWLPVRGGGGGGETLNKQDKLKVSVNQPCLSVVEEYNEKHLPLNVPAVCAIQ